MKNTTIKASIIGISLLVVIVTLVQYFHSEKNTTELKVKPTDKVTKTTKTTVILEELPDFTKFQDVKVKKESFFATMYPIIQQENLAVLKQRNNIVKLKNIDKNGQLNQEQTDWLLDISKTYRVKQENIDNGLFTKLLEKVDIIPPSLALTQSAIESGWGTSRFSKKANNIFGQWCFTKGCGIVPLARDSGKGHEVATFDTVNHAVRAYIKNLNTNSAYKKLRQKRAEIRHSSKKITGVALAKTLDKYSEEGHHYIDKLTNFIRINKLNRFNQKFELLLTPKKEVIAN